MIIQHITRYAGPDGNYPPGFVREMDDKAALDLINGGFALCLDEPKQEKAKPHKKAVSKK